MVDQYEFMNHFHQLTADQQEAVYFLVLTMVNDQLSHGLHAQLQQSIGFMRQDIDDAGDDGRLGLVGI